MKKLQIGIIYYEDGKSIARSEIEEHTDRASIKVFTEMLKSAIIHFPEDFKKAIKDETSSP